MVADFLSAARARGLLIEHINTDGKIHRVPVDGKPKTDNPGWYVYHAGGEWACAVFGRWDDGLPDGKWCERNGTPWTPEEKARIRQTMRDVQAETEKRHREAADAARDLFGKATVADNSHAYLQNKRVKAFGLRVSGAALLIPLRDAGGALWSLQRITPNGEKRFYSGGRTSGCFHWVGDPAGAAWLLLAEGYATAATVHEATGLPVAAAMNCGNLLPVAESLAAKYPNARFLVCADDDRKTEADGKGNPGRKSAGETVMALNKGLPKGQKRARFVLPDGLPDGGSDFNDLAAVSGVDEVRRQIEAAIEPSGEQQEDAPPADPPQHHDYGSGRFELSGSGVYFVGTNKEGEELPPRWICSPLRIVAKTRDAKSGEWGRLLEWRDDDGISHRWAMPMALLQGDGSEVRCELSRLGLSIAPSKSARDLLASFLQVWPVEARARCVDRLGWHGSVYVTPSESIGEDGEIVVFQNDHAIEPALSSLGTVDDWRESVASLAAGNTRLVFALSVAFAGALAEIIGEDSGGFHFRGSSSSGKTTALKLAASVWGNPQTYTRLWRSTTNGLEGLAALHNDGLLILDELSQIDPREAGSAAYLLANGQGKARASRTGTARQSARWRLLFLSAGEESLSGLMLKSGKRANAGQEIRLADIDADANSGMGAFENIHGHESPAAFAVALKDAASSAYGAVGVKWLRQVVGNRQALIHTLIDGLQQFVGETAPKEASGQVLRVVRRFGLVAAAGEIATHFGLTGWEEGEADVSAKQCFAAWLEGFGGVGNKEERAILEQVRAFFETHGSSRFENMSATLDQRVQNRAGFYRTGADGCREYLVLTETFRREVCQGFDPKTVIAALVGKGWIEKGSDGKATQKPRLPGLGATRCYAFTGEIWGGET